MRKGKIKHTILTYSLGMQLLFTDAAQTILRVKHLAEYALKLLTVLVESWHDNANWLIALVPSFLKLIPRPLRTIPDFLFRVSSRIQRNPAGRLLIFSRLKPELLCL